MAENVLTNKSVFLVKKQGKCAMWKKRRDAGWELLCQQWGALRESAPPWRKGETGDRDEASPKEQASVVHIETEMGVVVEALDALPREASDDAGDVGADSTPIPLEEIIEMVEAEAAMAEETMDRAPEEIPASEPGLVPENTAADPLATSEIKEDDAKQPSET